MAALGSLVVSLEANIAKFTTDMGKAAYQTDQAMKQMQRSSDAVGAAIAGMAKGAIAALSIDFFAGMIKGAIDSMDALNDLKDATGASIANISALEDVAVRTGANIDTVGTAMIKFQKVLMDAKPGSQAELGLKALGLSADELKNKDLAEAMLDYAKALDKFADDGDKARLILDQTGKSVRELAPFLKDLAEQEKLVGTVSAEQTLEAEKFNKELFNMKKNAQDVAREIAGPLITAFNNFMSAQRDAKKEGKFGLFTNLQDMGAREDRIKDGNFTGTWGAPVGNAGRGVINPAFVKPSVGGVVTPAKTSTAKPEKSDAQKIEEDAQRFVAKLREQAETFGKSNTEVLQYQMSLSKFPQVYKDEAIALQSRIDAYKSAADEDKAFAAATEKFMGDRERDIQRNEANVAAIRISLMSGVEQEALAHQIVLDELQTFHDAKFENVALANALIEEENVRHQQALTDMQAAHDLQAVSMMSNSTDQLYGLMQKAGMEQSALGKAVLLANKALAVAQIIISTEVAAAKATEMFPVWGSAIAMGIRVAGYASAGLVGGMAIAEASAEGGYDIPSGTNPVTQLHEREMVLPKQHADVIRGLATNGGGGKGDFKLSLINNGTPHRVVETRQIAPDEWAMVVEDSVKAVAARLADPNSNVSRSFSRNYATQRSR